MKRILPNRMTCFVRSKLAAAGEAFVTAGEAASAAPVPAKDQTNGRDDVLVPAANQFFCAA